MNKTYKREKAITFGNIEKYFEWEKEHKNESTIIKPGIENKNIELYHWDYNNKHYVCMINKKYKTVTITISWEINYEI